MPPNNPKKQVVEEEEELPNWPCGDCDSDVDANPHGSGYSGPNPNIAACELLEAGGTWQSYTYRCSMADDMEMTNQMLISDEKGGSITMVPVDDGDFFIADCKLRLKTRDEIGESKSVKELEVVGDEGMAFESNLKEGYTYMPRLVKSGRSFQVESEGYDPTPPPVTFVTKENDIELCFNDPIEGCSLWLLLRKETPVVDKKKNQIREENAVVEDKKLTPRQLRSQKRQKL
jgi:hypothetical protein